MISEQPDQCRVDRVIDEWIQKATGEWQWYALDGGRGAIHRQPRGHSSVGGLAKFWNQDPWSQLMPLSRRIAA